MKIRELRRASGMTQTMLAERLGVSQSTVCGWETGTNMPMPALLPRLADLFGCTIDALYGREPPRDGGPQNSA